MKTAPGGGGGGECRISNDLTDKELTLVYLSISPPNLPMMLVWSKSADPHLSTFFDFARISLTITLNFVWNTYSEERFKKTFRVLRGTFQYILDRIRHILQRATVNEEPILPECWLAVCLYRLARGDYYYTIAEMTGLGVSSVYTIVNDIMKAIVENLWEECVTKHMPKTEEDFKKKMMDTEELP